ncbi:hypothetical protein B0H19DRAFT_1185122 [Mycena capillaripes]|nr:hypothetical protein B0H19DRAFT_1185122 [Mycena capillaripes]
MSTGRCIEYQKPCSPSSKLLGRSPHMAENLDLHSHETKHVTVKTKSRPISKIKDWGVRCV